MSELTKEYFDQKFDELDEKFVAKEYFDQRFGEFNEKFDKIDQKFIDLDQKISELPSKQDYNVLKSVVDNINEKITRFDKRSDEDVRAAYKDIEGLKNRVAVLEEK